MQSHAHKSTVAARTDAADRDAARVSTKANVTEEGTAGSKAQVLAVANVINAAAMQGDAKVLAVADMSETSRSQGNA